MAKKKDEIDGAKMGEETSPESKLETTPGPKEGPKPPTEEVFTYTKTERDNLINDGKAAIGRDLKVALDVNTTLKRTMTNQGTRLTDLEDTLTSVRKSNREKELSDAAGSTEVVDAIKLRHLNEDATNKLSKDRSDFIREKAEHQADIDEMTKSRATQLADELAKESGLAADLLLQIGSDQTNDDRTVYNLKRMRDVASKSPKGGEEEGGEEERGVVKGIRAKAASTGRAATGLRTFADFEQAYVAGEISREEYGKAAKRFNIQL